VNMKAGVQSPVTISPAELDNFMTLFLHSAIVTVSGLSLHPLFPAFHLF